VVNVEGDRPFDDLIAAASKSSPTICRRPRQLGAIRKASEAAVLAERQRLARELHDNVTQILSSMSLLSQTLGAAWQRSPAEGERRVARLQQLAQTAFAEMRMLLRQLAPPDSASHPAISRQGRSFVGLENLRTQALPGALTKLLAAMIPDGLAVRPDSRVTCPSNLENEEALYRVCRGNVPVLSVMRGPNACASKRRSPRPKLFASPTTAAASAPSSGPESARRHALARRGLHGNFRIYTGQPAAR
jgi:hypothetical protein